jgi:hypothetical protein
MAGMSVGFQQPAADAVMRRVASGAPPGAFAVVSCYYAKSARDLSRTTTSRRVAKTKTDKGLGKSRPLLHVEKHYSVRAFPH